MTSGDLNARRTRDVLLVALTVATGAVDAVSWLPFDKVFSAFMTGNIVSWASASREQRDPRSSGRPRRSPASGPAPPLRPDRLPEPSEETWPRRVTTALALVVLVEAAFLAVWVVVDGDRRAPPPPR